MGCNCNNTNKIEPTGACTPPVVEVVSPCNITMFEKVVIEASRGDDTTIPPENGMFRNTLLVYEANNHVYMYSSSGIPTRLNSDNIVSGTYTFNNVADMVANESLVAGSYAKTNGFYEVGDGGGATYEIVADITADNYFVLPLDNGLFARLIIENNQINVKQIGARNLGKDSVKYDLAPYVNAYLAYLELDRTHREKLYIPAGVWHTSPIAITRKQGFYIFGDENFTLHEYEEGTLITTLNDNQEYIFKIGNNLNMVRGWVLKNIFFSSKDYYWSEENNWIASSTYYKKVTDACVILEHAHFGITDNLFFGWIEGTALRVGSSWEDYHGLINFRNINAMEHGVMILDTKDNPGDNVTATAFEKIMAEAVLGDLIVARYNCEIGNTYFGTINFEGWPLTPTEDYVFTNITNDTDTSDFHHWSVFNVYGRLDVEVQNLQLNNFSYRYLTYQSNHYCYDTVVNVAQDNANPNMVINNLAVSGMSLDTPILRQNNYYMYLLSQFSVNNVKLNRSYKKLYFDVHGARQIQCDSKNLNASYVGRTQYKVTDGVEGVTEFASVAQPRSLAAQAAPYGPLYYDKDAQSRLGLVVKPYNANTTEQGAVTNSACTMLITGKKLMLRAKVPNGDSVQLRFFMEGGTTQNITLAGTGDYQVYTFDSLTGLLPGVTAEFRLATGMVGKDCWLDWYKFYN